MQTVPEVDLTAAGPALAEQLAQAMSLSGFFYLRNHHIRGPVTDELVRQAQAFFEGPASERQAIAIDQHNRGYLGPGEAKMVGATHHDLKEVFFFGRELAPDDPDLLAGLPLCAPNQWPAGRLAFRQAVVDYLDAACESGTALLTGFARMMGAPPDFFEPYYQRPMSRGQLIHYPAPPADAPTDQFGVAEHTDFGCITLLYQHTPGLQVLSRQGDWLSVPPRPGTLVVNIGDLLERWSNGRLPSTRHRVVNQTGDSRYAIAIFFDPSPVAIIDPADLISDGNPAQPVDGSGRQFEPVAAADYILGRSKGVFAQFQPKAG